MMNGATDYQKDMRQIEKLYLLTKTNKMERESFVFYRSFYDCIKDLDDKQTRELVVAICERALDRNENEIDDKIVKMAYNLIKPQIDANTKRYVD